MAKKKPADCPLFLHRNGQWAKKVRGRLLYFGTDLDAALKKWATEKDYHLAGLTPPKRSDAPTVEELANVFYDQQLAQAQRGLVSERHVAAIKTTLANFLDIVGRDATLDTMQPMHWAQVRQLLFRPAQARNPARGGVMGRKIDERSHVTVDGDIRRIRAFVNWCIANRHYNNIDFGSEFAETPAKVRRRLKADSPSRDMSAEALRAIIEKSAVNFKPLILLAINGGMGSTDIANITFADLANIQQPQCWVDLPRGKTGIDRRFCLWPETREAILDYLPTRPKPLRKQDSDIVFLTKARHRWVRDIEGKHIDSASSTFTKLRKEAGVDNGTFYGCRHTFATIASGCNDLMAVYQIMGFIPDQSDVLKSRYMQKVQNERLLEVTEFVRKWLFLGLKSVSLEL